jgi:hypothetical protein
MLRNRSRSTGISGHDRRNTDIETTVNDVSFFKHHRKVEHREGTSTYELAGLKKSIYTLIDLCEILLGCAGAIWRFRAASMTPVRCSVICNA